MFAVTEVVFHDGSRCGGRVFSMAGDFLTVAQLILAVVGGSGG